MASRLSGFRRLMILSLSVTCLGGAAWGVQNAMRSPMFLLQVVELADLPENAPVDAQTLSDLAALPIGKVNLFDLDLRPVEERILSNPWIREVRLEKQFPQTLSISVTFRVPQAIAQAENGVLSYVDVDGKSFGQVNLMVLPDLPVISASGSGHVEGALALIREWEHSEVSKTAQLSQIQWDSERGYRILVSYALERPTVAGAKGRTFIELGQDFDGQAAQTVVHEQFERLSKVFQYLGANRVLARQVWADAGKKIVVKTAHGS